MAPKDALQFRVIGKLKCRIYLDLSCGDETITNENSNERQGACGPPAARPVNKEVGSYGRIIAALCWEAITYSTYRSGNALSTIPESVQRTNLKELTVQYPVAASADTDQCLGSAPVSFLPGPNRIMSAFATEPVDRGSSRPSAHLSP
jgi:hypothetical protein